MNLSLEVRGLAELQKRYSEAPDLIGREMRDAMQQSVVVGQEVARNRAPVDTGRLQSHINTAIRGVMPDIVGVIGTDIKPYPEILELSGRTHYRAGPRAGQPTAGWLSGTLPEIRERVFAFFERAVERAAKILAK